jgi:Holliday junction resolvase-like predicted endonuclease
MSHVFVSGADEQNERDVARLLEKKWNCKIRKFGKLDPIDWWAERNNKVVAFIELKCRNVPSTKYDTVFVTLRKWLDLLRAREWSFDEVSSLIVIRWTDRIGYYDVTQIPPGNLSVLRRREHRAEQDVEPAWEIPIKNFKTIEVGDYA